jgi:hypothetical protein
MRLLLLLRPAPLVTAAIVSMGSVAACSRNHDRYDPNTGYYDTVNNDRHRWDTREDVAYRRWETQRNMQHADYPRRSADEQRAYWTWRHSNPDRD